jgi:hypothetical protein
MEIRKTTALKWRQLLGAPEGIEGMLYLRENIPSISGADPTALAFSAGKNQGYIHAIDSIMELANSIDNKKPSEEELLNKGLE